MNSAERNPGHVFRSHPPPPLLRWLPSPSLSRRRCSPSGTAVADPGQDQKFFDLLNQQDIPPVDNDNSLIDVAKKTCTRLDEGMSVGDLVELIRNNGFNENPLTRLQNQGRITRTIDRFINASVEAYCPKNRGKIASIAAYHGLPGGSRPRRAGVVCRTPPRRRYLADEAVAGSGSSPAGTPNRAPTSTTATAAGAPGAARTTAGTATTSRASRRQRRRPRNPGRPPRLLRPAPAHPGRCTRRLADPGAARPAENAPAKSDAGSARAAGTHQACALRH